MNATDSIRSSRRLSSTRCSKRAPRITPSNIVIWRFASRMRRGARLLRSSIATGVKRPPIFMRDSRPGSPAAQPDAQDKDDLELSMAVYTDIAAEDLARFLAGYDIGELLSYKGIAEGVENSNFLVHTSRGHFILTLYEKRVAEADLPFFIALMEHLAARGINCPQPVKNKSGGMLGRLAGRPAAIVTFLDGLWIRRPGAGHCAAVGEAVARLHLAGRDFKMRRENALSLPAWRLLYAQ